VFFLTLEELTATGRGETCVDVRRVVADRRAEYERNESITPPKVVVGRFDPKMSVPDTIDTGASVLKGLGASAGVVTGKAHVILRADTDEQLLAGEILVTPFTDAGWTPYFVPAAGIVIEQGGLLSHGSIIAREYGIPAVVNVSHATRILQPGQTVRVDGNRGIVTVLEDRADSSSVRLAMGGPVAPRP
jgi:pyruvate,water dikinase